MIAVTSRIALVLLLMTGLAIAADDAKSKPDAEAIRGKWKVVSLEADGKKVPVNGDAADGGQKAGAEIIIEFDADTVAHVKDGEKTDPSAYTLASDKDPKEIEFKPKNGEDAGKTLKGIYDLKESKLRICFAKAEGERPKEFKSAEGVILLELERVKEEQKK